MCSLSGIRRKDLANCKESISMNSSFFICFVLFCFNERQQRKSLENVAS